MPTPSQQPPPPDASPAPPSRSAEPLPAGEPAIRVMMMPRDTNVYGTIFGGVLLAQIDLAGIIEARKQGPAKFVTVAMDAIEFKEPVHVGDLVSFHTETIRVGRTSVRVRITVVAQRFTDPAVRVHVTRAEATYVAIDDNRRPVALRRSPDAPPGSN